MRAFTGSIVFILAIATASSYAASDASSGNFNGLQLAQSSSVDASSNASTPTSIYGPVRRKENLWNISKLHQFKGATMSQLMMGIYQNNRSAFYENNINRLKTGARLNIPPAKSILAIDQRQAYSEVVVHIDEYETYVKNRDRVEVPPANEPTNTIAITEEPATDEIDQTSLDLTTIEVIKKELILEQAQVEQDAQQATVPVKPKREKPKKPSRPLLRYSYDVSFAHDDNIRRAQNEVDIRSDTILNMTLHAKGGKSLSRFSLMSYGGSIGVESFSEFSELDNINFNVNVKYRFAFASGFSSPIYSIGLKVGGIESDQRARDASVYSVNAGLNKWITNTINLSLGLDHKEQESRSRVFDTVEDRIFANLDINLSKTALVYTTYTFITGDTVSSATPTLAIINASEEIEPDDAFGGIATNQFAYRLDSDTQVITLGYNKAFSPQTSVDFSYRFVKTESEGNIEYDRTIFRASLLGRF